MNYCLECEGDMVSGRCVNCGWMTEQHQRLAALKARTEEKRRASVRKAHGPHAKRRTREERESPFAATLPGGHICPVCAGRGWTTNACDSCYLCLGRGRVSAYVLATVKR